MENTEEMVHNCISHIYYVNNCLKKRDELNSDVTMRSTVLIMKIHVCFNKYLFVYTKNFGSTFFDISLNKYCYNSITTDTIKIL